MLYPCELHAPRLRLRRLRPTRVLIGMNLGGDLGLQGLEPRVLEPAPPCEDSDAEACKPGSGPDGLPAVEIRDRRTGEFVLFPQLDQGRVFSLADPTRWVEASTGELEVRFTNDRAEGIGFQFNVQLEGDVS